MSRLKAFLSCVLCLVIAISVPLPYVWAEEADTIVNQVGDEGVLEGEDDGNGEGVGDEGDARNGEGVGDESEKIVDQVRNDEDARNDEGVHNDETDEATDEDAIEISPTAAGYSIEYQAHVAFEGWKNWTQEGKLAGTTGKSRSIEALNIRLKGSGLKGSVEYRTHVQNKGWLDYTKDGKTSGTTGKSLRTEAINIRLTGEIQQAYDIYYRVHVQNFGWLGWAKNDERAGSAGYGLRMEAIEIRLVEKGKKAPEQTGAAFKKPAQSVVARAHVQNLGWQGWVAEGTTTGTTGRGYRMEALCLQVANADYSGSIEYRAHVSGIGWQGWKSSGATAGTTGQSRQMEALQMRLTGELAKKYDLYYRVHSANFGWLGWAKNSEVAGITGFSCRMEAAQVRLVAKGSKAPGSTTNPSVELTYTSQGHVASKGWLAQGSGRRVVGTTGQGLRMEAFKLSVKSNISGGIEYRAHVQNVGWQGWKRDGVLAGTEGQSKRVEAVGIRLTGDLSKYFDVYYRAHVSNIGWMGWAKNGANAGTGKLGHVLEAFEITIVAKGAPAPGSTARAYRETNPHGICSVLGISPSAVLNELSKNERTKFYLGTPWRPYDWRSPNGDISYNGTAGMNCTGFVWCVFNRSGANGNRIPHLGGTSYCAGTWMAWVQNNKVTHYTFRTKAQMLASGVLEKGDVFFLTGSDDCHVGFFWGDSPNEDKFWHSSGTNKISGISSGYLSYTVIKL
jgi:uncharacterized protein YjdB